MRLSEISLQKHDVGFGLTQYENADFVLAGGFRSGNSSAGTTRLKYMIYDRNLITKPEDAEQAEIGFVELFVKDDTGEIVGLVNIEIKPEFRKGGYGKRVVQDIKDTAGSLTVHDIQKKAKSFWDKQGVKYTDRSERTGKLNEYEFPEVQQKTQWSIPDMYKKDLPGKEQIGSGGFATAYADKDNPHEVTKGSSRMFMLDGYMSFIEALSKDKDAQSNPYFPHFSDINTYKNKLWRTKSYDVKMERLHKPSTLSDAEKAMLREHMFTEYYNTSAVGEKLDLHTLMAHAIHKNKTEWMQDENLIAATKFLHAASKEYGFDLDLNPGNFMIRRGPFMPQVVIIDPLGTKTGQGWTI